jgi:glycosyltransferase involved in cell wall biosynthesis
MITETWVPPDDFLGFTRPLRERFHPGLQLAPIKSFNISTLVFELSARALRLSGWPLVLRRNRWFQERALSLIGGVAKELGHNDKPVLFAYSYAAIELMRFAKMKGWRTVLGQIDGGPCDEEIVANEHKNHRGAVSGWQRAPQEYWSSWKEECSLADTIIVNSHWSKELLIEAGIEATKLQVIPVAYEPPVDAREFRRSYPESFSEVRPLRVLFVGLFALRKGAAAVLEAMSRLAKEPVEFWVVGSIAIDIPAPLRDSSKVKWIGPVSRESTTSFYRNADLFLFPTVSDGFGMTQVEARGWKLPVIATPFCAPIVKDGINGLVLTEISGESLSKAIRFLLQEPNLLTQLSTGSAQEYEDYSFASVRARLLSLGN